MGMLTTSPSAPSGPISVSSRPEMPIEKSQPPTTPPLSPGTTPLPTFPTPSPSPVPERGADGAAFAEREGISTLSGPFAKKSLDRAVSGRGRVDPHLDCESPDRRQRRLIRDQAIGAAMGELFAADMPLFGPDH